MVKKVVKNKDTFNLISKNSLLMVTGLFFIFFGAFNIMLYLRSNITGFTILDEDRNFSLGLGLPLFILGSLMLVWCLRRTSHRETLIRLRKKRKGLKRKLYYFMNR